MGDGFKDLGQVCGEWRNAISWREEHLNKMLKCLEVDSILERHIILETILFMFLVLY